jgi:hypothetical protein
VYVVGYWMEGVDNKLMYSVNYLENSTKYEIKHRGLVDNLQNNINFTNSNGWNFVNNNGSITINKLTENDSKLLNIYLKGYKFS